MLQVGLLLLDVMLAAQLRGQPLGWLLMLAAQLLKHFQGGLVAWVAANRVQRGVTLMAGQACSAATPSPALNVADQ